MDEVGAGIAVKNTARCTMILLQGFGVPMRRIIMLTAVRRRTGSSKKTTVAVDTVPIVQRGGRSRLFLGSELFVRLYNTSS